jgi:CHAT domain-containing protein/Tfp pilus assembly protein PilF
MLLVVVPSLAQNPPPGTGSEQERMEKRKRAETIAQNAFSLFRQSPNELRASIEKAEEARGLFAELGDKESEAGVLKIIADGYQKLGENRRALEHLKLALPLIVESGHKEGRIVILDELGEAYANLGEIQKALDLHLEALALAEGGDNIESKAITLAYVGKSHLRLGQPQTAIEFYNQALRIVEGTARRRGNEELLTLLGDAYLALGEVQRAQNHYERVLQLYISSKSRMYEAYMRSYIANAYARAGDRTKAIEYYNQALQGISGNERGEIEILNAIGQFQLNIGEKQRAIEIFGRALDKNADVNDETLQALTLNNIGLAHSGLSENEKAFGYYNRSLELSTKAGNKGLRAITLTNLGFLYNSLGEHDKAADHYEQVLLLQRELGNVKGEAIALNNLGLIYLIKGNKQKALDHYKRALELDKSFEEVALGNIAGVYLTSKDNRAAIDQYTRALQLSRASGNKSAESAALNNLGVTYIQLNEWRKAVETLDQVQVLYRSTADRRGEIFALSNLMEAWQRLQKPRLAIFYGKQAVNMLQSLRAGIQGFDKDVQKSFLATVDPLYRRLAELLVREKRLPEAEQVIRMLKDEEYFEFVSKGGRVIASLDERIKLDPTEQLAFEQYETALSEIGKIHSDLERLQLEKITAPAGEIKAIEEKLERTKGDLKIAGSKLQMVVAGVVESLAVTEAVRVDLEKGSQAIIKEWKDPQTAIVSTIVGAESLTLIVTTAKSQRGYVRQIPEERLKQLVDSFRSAITKARYESSDPHPTAQALYDELMKPIEKDLETAHIRTVVWSLDKFLRYIPVSALWDSRKGYVVQKYANVVLALAGRQNLAFRPVNKGHWRALGVGTSKRSGNLEALTNVPKELGAIVNDLASETKSSEMGLIAGKRLLDEQFTFAEFRKSLGTSYPFTHAATHFVFIPGTKAEGLNSYLMMGNGEKLTLAQIQNTDNIFAGIELLTLSACDTGYGGITRDGREIEGLGVLAQRKGARAIMATLWPVDDESTRHLMVEFYRGYQKPGVSKAEALRKAQLAVLGEPDLASSGPAARRPPADSKRFPNPYHWSPFILIGNWR